MVEFSEKTKGWLPLNVILGGSVGPSDAAVEYLDGTDPVDSVLDSLPEADDSPLSADVGMSSYATAACDGYA